jgi:hypothetical protein
MQQKSETDSQTKEIQKNIITDKDGNEISRFGKWISGLLLILLTLFSIIIIVGYWPDRLPAPKESIKPLYRNKIFHVSLVGIPDSARIRYDDENVGTVAEKTGIVVKNSTINPDTGKRISDSIKNLNTKPPSKMSSAEVSEQYPSDSKLIHINTLLLVLVAAGGFLGNLIYISTSLTTYLGAGKFKRSWALWYCIKPFTAAGLAITIYFVFRGGFLNMSDNSTNINIYGVLTISLLAGLFTDRTTLKLKEVFDVLLKPKEDRPDALEGEEIKITSIEPKEIEATKVNIITVKGKNLNTEDIIITIEGEKIASVEKTDEIIMFAYSIPDEQKAKTKLKILISNEKMQDIYQGKLTIKEI